MKTLLSILSTCFIAIQSFGQCNAGEVEVTIEISTDLWGYEGYWELAPNGTNCGAGAIFTGGNSGVGCSGTAQTSGGYGNSGTFMEGPWCLTEGGSYDIISIDSYGDGGTGYTVYIGGFPIYTFSGSSGNETFTFSADLPPEIEAELTSIETPAYVIGGTIEILGDIDNNGSSTITSMDLNYSIDNGATVTESLTGLSIAGFTSYAYNHGTPWIETATGTYLLKVWFSNINGQGDDVNVSDNEMQQTVTIKEPVPNIIPSYTSATSTFTYDVIANSTNQVNKPSDLDFHPNGDLWVVNLGLNASQQNGGGGSTVKITNPSSSSPTIDYKKDQNSGHFMSLPSAIAFSDNGNFANSPSVLNANFSGGIFTGPALWSSDPAIYAQPSGGNGSHLDMLHESPYSMGIAHYRDNAFWLFDAYSNDIVMYDFHDDHGPGNTDHDDGVVLRYPEIVVDWISQAIPSHLKYDKGQDQLFIMDGGNGRIIKMDASSGTIGGTPSFSQTETLAQYANVTGVAQTDIVTSGFTEGCGIDVIDNYIIVSDFSNGDIIIYDQNGGAATEVARLQTGSAGVTGVVIGPEGYIWYVNKTTNEVIKITPSQILLSAEDINTDYKLVSISPNPARYFVNVNLVGDWNETSTIQIFDIYGKLVSSTSTNSSTHQINTTELASGIYMIQVSSGTTTKVEKLIIE